MDHCETKARETLLAQARKQAAEAGLSLAEDGGTLVLSDGVMALHADYSHMAHRVRPQSLTRELLVRAAKLKDDGLRLRAVDATAGLGEDSLLLAAAGFEVHLYERNPVIAALALCAIDKPYADPALSDAAKRMRLAFGDSVTGLSHLDRRPDVVLLDPMFPMRQKNAAVKKKLQLLQQLERPCEDEGALIEAAFAAHPRKVIVKRPAKGPHLAGRKPDYALEGKAVRFDCYVFAS